MTHPSSARALLAERARPRRRKRARAEARRGIAGKCIVSRTVQEVTTSVISRSRTVRLVPVLASRRERARQPLLALRALEQRQPFPQVPGVAGVALPGIRAEA